MPNIRTSKAHKLQRHREVQRKYRFKWKDAINHRQKMIMRSRHAKFKNRLAFDDDLRFHRRRNQERVERYRSSLDPTENAAKQAIARKKWAKCEQVFERESRQ